MYSFRIRYRLGDTVRIESTATELVLADPAVQGESVVSRPTNVGALIVNERVFCVRGMGYPSESSALEAGHRWCGLVQIVFARLGIGADFGDRAPKAAFTEYGLQMVSAENGGARVLNDVHGLMVFETDPQPLFAAQEVTAIVGKPVDRLLQAIASAEKIGADLPDDRRLAYDLFGASFFQKVADSRFMLLMMALETMIEQRPRDRDVVAHVDTLIRNTQDSTLSPNDIQSLVRSLETLRQESIGQAGRELARTLGERRYMEMAPTEFFTHCYNIRGDLAHGAIPRPTSESVGLAAAHLEHFVGDLLGHKLLYLVAD